MPDERTVCPNYTRQTNTAGFSRMLPVNDVMRSIITGRSEQEENIKTLKKSSISSDLITILNIRVYWVYSYIATLSLSLSLSLYIYIYIYIYMYRSLYHGVRPYFAIFLYIFWIHYFVLRIMSSGWWGYVTDDNLNLWFLSIHLRSPYITRPPP